jgi:DNA-directed RNA polymerase specialized sigma24 family protein
LFSVGVSIKKKKKKIKLSKKNILENELKTKYKLDIENLLNIEEKLKKRYGFSIKDVLDDVRKEKDEEELEIKVPIMIFRQKISPAEALSKYLRENEKLRFSEISKLINRDERTIWINYRNAVKKKLKVVDKKQSEHELIYVPIKVFSNRTLSILESIVNYLKDKGLKNSEIAEMLNKDQRNVWTIYNRVKSKLKK